MKNLFLLLVLLLFSFCGCVKKQCIYFDSDLNKFIFKNTKIVLVGSGKYCPFEVYRSTSPMSYNFIGCHFEYVQKPSIVRNRIVELMGNLPRIELFARQKVEGWDALGFDIDGKDIRENLDEIINSPKSGEEGR